MKKLLLALLFCSAAFAADGFQPLFNGKNLDGCGRADPPNCGKHWGLA